MNIRDGKFKELLAGCASQAVLITDPLNMRYLSGFRGGEGMVYISGKRLVLITDSRYTEAAGKETADSFPGSDAWPDGFAVIEESRSHKRYEILAELLSEDGAERAAFEDLSMTCADFRKMQEALPMVNEWVPAGDQADRLRRIKTPEEIELLAKAESIGDAAFSDMLNIIRPGLTELEVAAELEYSMKKHGAEGFSFESIVASGLNSSMPNLMR